MWGIIIFYITLVVLSFAWIAYTLKIPTFALLLLLLATLFPAVTALLSIYNSDKPFSFINAGPVGDWISGSTVPFLTLATFWVAFETYKSQRHELQIAKKENQDARRQQIIPFLHIDIINKSKVLAPKTAEVIHFLRDSQTKRMQYSDIVTMQTDRYDSLHLKITNIGNGLATQLRMDEFGGYSDSIHINEGDHKDLKSFFIQANHSREFLIFVPVADSKFTSRLKLSFCDMLGNLYCQEYDFHFDSIMSIKYKEKDILVRDYSIHLTGEGNPELIED